MASPWLPSRPRRRRLGGRSPAWRCAGSTKILRRLRVLRTRVFRAALLHAERTLLGRMALARTPRGGLLTQRASSRNCGKEDPAPGAAGLLFAAGRQMSGDPGTPHRSISGPVGINAHESTGLDNA